MSDGAAGPLRSFDDVIRRSAEGSMAAAGETVPDVGRLEQEIFHAHADLVNAIEMRRVHPSYGYTKTQIRGQLIRVLGLIEAHMLVTGAWTNAGAPLSTDVGAYADRLQGGDHNAMRRDWL